MALVSLSQRIGHRFLLKALGKKRQPNTTLFVKIPWDQPSYFPSVKYFVHLIEQRSRKRLYLHSWLFSSMSLIHINFPSTFLLLHWILGHITFVKNNFGCKVNGYQPKAGGRCHISGDWLCELNQWTHKKGRDNLGKKKSTVQDGQIWTDASACCCRVWISHHHHERNFTWWADTERRPGNRRRVQATTMSILVGQLLSRKVVFEETQFLFWLSCILFIFILRQIYLKVQENKR